MRMPVYLTSFVDDIKREQRRRFKARQRAEFWLLAKASATGFVGAALLVGIFYALIILASFPHLF